MTFLSLMIEQFPYIFGIAVVLIVFLNVIRDNIRKVPLLEEQNAKSLTNYHVCTNPNCVRCNRYSQICRQAVLKLEKRGNSFSERLTDSMRSMEHQHNVLHRKNSTDQTLEQCPSVFHMQGLLALPFWNTTDFQKDKNILTENYKDILNEFQDTYKNYDFRWLINTTPNGSWRIFPIINQGVLMEENAAICPKTTQVIQKLISLMNWNVFGNATFSVVDPRTSITEHYGPTNIRIRCHLGLVIPDNCRLHVSGKEVGWKDGEVLFFDDSFRHCVESDGNEFDEIRAILMVDLWHPEILDSERKAIDYLFSPEHELID